MNTDPNAPAALVKCPTCDGTGEVHSHNPRCWTCHGAGQVVPDLAAEAQAQEYAQARMPRRGYAGDF